MSSTMPWQWDGPASWIVVLREGGHGLRLWGGLLGWGFRCTRLGLEFPHQLPRGFRYGSQPGLEFPLSVHPGRTMVELRSDGAGGPKQDETHEERAHPREARSQCSGSVCLSHSFRASCYFGGLSARPRGCGKALERPFRRGEFAVQRFPLMRCQVTACPRQQLPGLFQVHLSNPRRMRHRLHGRGRGHHADVQAEGPSRGDGGGMGERRRDGRARAGTEKEQEGAACTPIHGRSFTRRPRCARAAPSTGRFRPG